MIKKFLQKYLGANYSTTLGAALTAFIGFVTFAATLPQNPDYQLIQQFLPPEDRAEIVKFGLLATALSHLFAGWLTKSKNVVGGNVLQDGTGTAVATSDDKSGVVDISVSPAAKEVK